MKISYDIVKERYAADLARCSREVVEARGALRKAEGRLEKEAERNQEVKELLDSMEYVRNMGDVEVRLRNLPIWYTGDLLKYPALLKMEIREGNINPKLIAEDFCRRVYAINDCIHAYHQEIYGPEFCENYTYKRELRPGRKASEFDHDWFQFPNQWAEEYRDRQMNERTYKMIMNEDPKQILELIKTGKLDLQYKYKINLHYRLKMEAIKKK